MKTKVCGCGPDIIKINEQEEIGCFSSDARFRFADGTDICMRYTDGKWNVEVTKHGTADVRVFDEGFEIDSNTLVFEVIDR